MKEKLSHKFIIAIAASLLTLLLCACGKTTCDFCGQQKVCKEFDVMGTTRHICNDCLNNTASAVSGNVARQYAELFENGTLEYPADSPLADHSEDEQTEGEESAETPEPVEVYTPVDDSSDNNEQNDEQADPGQTDSSAEPTEDTPVDTSGLTNDALISDLNRKLQADSMILYADTNDTNIYHLYENGGDTGIVFTVSPGTSGDKISICQYSPDSSQAYVKAVIRSILTYVDSNDYDGLGHDIYNGTIQNGNYTQSGISFYSSIGTADEIERGLPSSTFEIVP